MSSFQIYSDLHLEFYKSYPKIKPKADNLILAGDIFNFSFKLIEDFLEYISKNWNKVFFVFGNHEFYSSNLHFFKIKNKYINLFDNYKNIFLLDNTSHILDSNTIILGSTFWSKVNFSIKDIINDFRKIKYYDENKERKVNITCEFINNLHLEQKKWLENKLKNLEELSFKNIIIISHFPLTQNNTSDKKYKDQDINLKNYFSNNFDNILEKYKEKNIYVISGHTHHSYDFMRNNIRYVSNQLGYPDENHEDFDENFILYINE